MILKLSGYCLEIEAKFVNLSQGFVKTREVGEFISGALAGAMTKAVLAPLETIRFVDSICQ